MAESVGESAASVFKAKDSMRVNKAIFRNVVFIVIAHFCGMLNGSFRWSYLPPCASTG
jgi:hypothetical protein